MSQMSLMDIKLNVKRKHLKTTNYYTLLDIKYDEFHTPGSLLTILTTTIMQSTSPKLSGI